MGNPLYFITGNTGKFTEIQSIIPEIKRLNLDLDEIQSLDPKIVIKHKLDQASRHHDGTFIVEDTSLVLNCLGELPGTMIKWFLASLGPSGIAELVGKYDNTSAIARTVIGYRDRAGESHFFNGEIPGHIVSPRGTHGFGWDVIFVPEGFDHTFAELGPDIKTTISMRRQAAQKLKTHLLVV